jgi:putative cell wall-binding protein
MRRGSYGWTTLLVTALVIAAFQLPAAAAEDEIYPMIFPVAGPNYYGDTWGAARSGGRTHQGTDIMADKMVPVVAVASGTVYWMQDEQGGKCCALGLRHDDDWISWYIHLNNDTPGTDDGQGWGFAPGIEVGVHVEAGEVIAYVGDSGNAESTASHLHFELHQPGDIPINPYQSLLVATTALLPRTAGANRFATAVAISKSVYSPGVGKVYVANGYGFADALAGGPAAAVDAAPILLVTSTGVPAETRDELLRLQPLEIVLLGGEGVINASVEAQMSEYTSGPVTRLAGQDRFGTAAAISAATYPAGADTVYVASGYTFADALAGSPVAGAQGAPLLLVGSDSVPPETASELARLQPSTIIILGGEAVVSLGVEDTLSEYGTVARLAGASRYGTAVEVSRSAFAPGIETVYIATGADFADALAGAPMAALRGAPILLVSASALPPETLAEIERLAPAQVVILGGGGAVGATVEYELWAAIS